MKKNIFLLLIAVFVLFISACADDEEETVAGSSCSSEGAEICSDNGIELLLCEDSTWTLKKQCNISIGKKCRQGADGTLGCYGDGEDGGSGNSSGGGQEDHGISDSDPGQNTGETDEDNSADTDIDTENPDYDNTSEYNDSIETDADDSDNQPQTDTEPNDTDDETPDEETDNDSYNDTDNIPDNDNDTTEPPAGQCSSNSDCSGSTPYCSISTSQCIANAVFITEYIEGSGNNRAIEIYNGSKSTVDLNSYTIQQANNGNSWGYQTSFIYSFPSSSQLNPGGIYIVCNSQVSGDLSSKCSDKTSSSTFNFTGNDGIALFEDNTIIDQVGNNDGASIEYWSVAGISSATQDHTLRRKTSVIQGTTDWAASAGTTAENSQWEVLSIDTFDGLGQR